MISKSKSDGLFAVAVREIRGKICFVEPPVHSALGNSVLSGLSMCRLYFQKCTIGSKLPKYTLSIQKREGGDC